MNRIEFYSRLNEYKDLQENKDSSLQHYGTLGQKWGVRKWQNADGTFNEAGKERYFGKSKKAHPKDEKDELTNKRLNDIKKFYSGETSDQYEIKEGPNGSRHIIPKGQKIGKYYTNVFDATRAAIADAKEAKEKGIGSLLYQNLDGTLTRRGKKLLKKYRNGNEKAADKIDKLINMDLYEKTVAEPINIKKTETGHEVNSGVDSSLKDYQLSKYMSKRQVDRAMKHRDLLEEIANTMYSEATAENLLKFRDQINSIEDKKERNAVMHAMSSMMAQMKYAEDGEGYNFRFEGKFGSQPGAEKAKEEANTELFSKKNENGRSETADKMEEAAKKLREDGNDELANETEKTAKEMRDATSTTPERKKLTKEEKKELKNASNRAWKAATKGNWVYWFLFGIIGGCISNAASWATIKNTAKEVGIDTKSKEWTAADWDKITYVLQNGKYKM